MRILFLTHQYFPRSIGGTEMLVRGLVTRLRAHGHEAVVLAYVESPGNQMHDFGFRVTEFEGAPLWELHYNLGCAENPAEAEFDNLLLAQLVVRAAREIKPDAIHAAHLMKLSGAVLPRLAREGFPVVVTLSDYWPLCLRHTLLKPDGAICETGPDHPQRCLACAKATHGLAKPSPPCADEAALWQRAREATADPSHPDAAFRRDVLALARRTESLRAALLGARRLIALSDFQRGIFLQNGYPGEGITVLRHGVETAELATVRARRREPGFAPAAPRRIVFIGTLAAHKGPHILLEAMQTIPGADLILELHGPAGGDGEYVARLRALAGGDPRVKLCGPLPPERMGDVLQEAFALALPAQWHENEPLVVKAALWCGVPVAAGRIGSLAQLITPEHNGWLLPVSDIDAWAEWLKEPAPCSPLPGAQETAVPTADEFAAQMMQIYQDLARSAR